MHNTYIPNDKKVNKVKIDGCLVISGQNHVSEIIYHVPCGDGDRHFVDIVLDDMTVERRFNIDAIVWKE